MPVKQPLIHPTQVRLTASDDALPAPPLSTRSGAAGGWMGAVDEKVRRTEHNGGVINDLDGLNPDEALSKSV